MRHMLTALTLALVAAPSAAALNEGRAHQFLHHRAVGGKPFKLNLAEQLSHGPCRPLFLPHGFTKGCTLERTP